MISEILNKKQENHISSGKFSISSVGTCWRKKFLELKGLYKEDFTEETKRIFEIGNLFHRRVIEELIEKGNNGIHVVGAEINIPEHKYISGRIDIVVSDGKDLYIVDVKSASTWTIDKTRQGEVSENYKNQVLLYQYFTGIHNGILLFIGKNKGEIIEVKVDYDEKKAKMLVKEIEDFFINFVEKNMEPPACTKDISPFGCQCCRIKGEWK